MTDCECWPVPNPWTYFGAVEPGGALEPNPDCPVHFPAKATDCHRDDDPCKGDSCWVCRPDDELDADEQPDDHKQIGDE